MIFDEILVDLGVLSSRLLGYLFSLDQMGLLLHFAAIIIGTAIVYGNCYRFHVWIMADHGISWTWLLRGIYIIFIVGAATGTLYGWAKHDVKFANDHQGLVIGFFIIPLVAAGVLLASANYAARTVKIERTRRKGDPLGA